MTPTPLEALATALIAGASVLSDVLESAWSAVVAAEAGQR